MRSLKHRSRLLTIVSITCLLAGCLAAVSTGTVFSAWSQRTFEATEHAAVAKVIASDQKSDAVVSSQVYAAPLAMLPGIAASSQDPCNPDTIPPVLIGCPFDANFQCLADVPPSAPVTAMDNCLGAIAPTLTETTMGSCPTIITRTWRAVDSSNNSATCTQTITVRDTIPPVLNGVPANATFQCLTDVPPPPNVTATDNCGAVTPTFTETTTGSCPTIITRTWRAVDACGNSATATRTITVRDTIPPVLAGVPASGTFQCLADVPTATVTATDNCDGAPPVTFTETQINPGSSCNNVITRTWRAVDACGNSTTATRTFTVRDTIPPVLTGVPGNITVQCSTEVPPASAVTATDNCNSTLPVTLTETQNNNVITRTWTAMDSCGNTTSASAAITITDSTASCTPVGPGTPAAADGVMNDQKPGSILVFPIYASSSVNTSAENTRFAITNLNPTFGVVLHLFFVDGRSCSVRDSSLCLSQSQTMTFNAADYDPDTTGYLIVVAADKNTGCPIKHNFLVGSESVKLASGHNANLAAWSFSALKENPSTCDPTGAIATLNFDGVNYNAVPRVVALDNFASPTDDVSTLFVLHRLGGNLTQQADSIGSLFGLLYDDQERQYSFSASGGCQLVERLSNNFPSTAPRLSTAVSSGHTGWIKLYGNESTALIGATLTRSRSLYSDGHNLHALTFTTKATLTIPVFPPLCR